MNDTNTSDPSIQLFQAYTPGDSSVATEIFGIRTHCDNNGGQYFVLWKDIKDVLPQAMHILDSDNIVHFIRDEGLDEVKQLRIACQPGVVLRVVLPARDDSADAIDAVSVRSASLSESVIDRIPDFVAQANDRAIPHYESSESPSNLHRFDPHGRSLESTPRQNIVATSRVNFTEPEPYLDLAKRNTRHFHDALNRGLRMNGRGSGQLADVDEDLRAGEPLDEMHRNRILAQEVDEIKQQIQREQREADERLKRLHKEYQELKQEYQAMKEQELDGEQLALASMGKMRSRITTILDRTYEPQEDLKPRLFIVLLARSNKGNTLGTDSSTKFRLYFLCECSTDTNSEDDDFSQGIHLVKHEGYDIRNSDEFFQKYGPYVLTMLQMVKYGFVATGVTVPALAHFKQIEGIDAIQQTLDISQATIGSLVDDSIAFIRDQVANMADRTNVPTGSSELDNQEVLEGADLQLLESYLEINESNHVLGNLYQIVDSDSHAKWVCSDHRSDPAVDEAMVMQSELHTDLTQESVLHSPAVTGDISETGSYHGSESAINETVVMQSELHTELAMDTIPHPPAITSDTSETGSYHGSKPATDEAAILQSKFNADLSMATIPHHSATTSDIGDTGSYHGSETATDEAEAAVVQSEPNANITMDTIPHPSATTGGISETGPYHGSEPAINEAVVVQSELNADLTMDTIPDTPAIISDISEIGSYHGIDPAIDEAVVVQSELHANLTMDTIPHHPAITSDISETNSCHSTDPAINEAVIMQSELHTELAMDTIPHPLATTSDINEVESYHDSEQGSYQSQDLVESQELVELQELVEPKGLVEPQELVKPQEFVEPQELVESYEVVESQGIEESWELVEPKELVESTREILANLKTSGDGNFRRPFRFLVSVEETISFITDNEDSSSSSRTDGVPSQVDDLIISSTGSDSESLAIRSIDNAPEVQPSFFAHNQTNESSLDAFHSGQKSQIAYITKSMEAHLERLKLEIDKNNDLQKQLLEREQEINRLQEDMKEWQEAARRKEDEMRSKLLERQEVEIQKMQLRAVHEVAAIQNRVRASFKHTRELNECAIPRLFIILPKTLRLGDERMLVRQQFRVFFLCECGVHTMTETSKAEHEVHLAKHEGYDISKPAEFLQKYGLHVLTVLQWLRYEMAVAGFVASPVENLTLGDDMDINQDNLSSTKENIGPLLDYSIKFIEAQLNHRGGHSDIDTISGQAEPRKPEVLKATELRQLRSHLV
ncbi:hypothetical protein BGZ99_002631, partial [Dissophora globulifera]